MRVLFDTNIPRPLAKLLAHHHVRTAIERGWGALSNGDLLDAAENDGYQCLLTADNNIRYQQCLAHRRIALVVLSTNQWSLIRANAAMIVAGVDAAKPGSYEDVKLPRQPLVRRPPPG